jgi:hypothetical protein
MTKKYYNLREIFANVNGSSFVGLDTESVVSLKGGKKNEQQGRVTKRTLGSQVMVFTNQESNGYENMVQRRLIEEGKDPTSFKVGERVWGKRVPNLPIVEHEKDGVIKEYLEVIFLKAGTSEYFLDGLPIKKEDIIGLQEKDDKPTEVPGKDDDPTNKGQAGLDDKVIVRTYGADSIVAIRIDGVEYQFK